MVNPSNGLAAMAMVPYHTWTAIHGEAEEAFPRNMHVQLCVTLPGKKLRSRILCEPWRCFTQYKTLNHMKSETATAF